MSIAVFFKLDVPEVQHTSDNSKEMLVTRGTLLESGFPVPTAPGMVLIFVPRVNRGNVGWAEEGEGDNLLQRYPNHKATASRHHAVPRDRALCPPIPQPPGWCPGPPQHLSHLFSLRSACCLLQSPWQTSLFQTYLDISLGEVNDRKSFADYFPVILVVNRKHFGTSTLYSERQVSEHSSSPKRVSTSQRSALLSLSASSACRGAACNSLATRFHSC